jgi:ferrous iron transport protein A
LRYGRGVVKPPSKKGSVIPLADLRPGEEGVIVSITGGRGALQRLVDLGLTPGTKVSVIKASPFHGPLEITVRGSDLALGRGVAMKILVEVL